MDWTRRNRRFANQMPQPLEPAKSQPTGSKPKTQPEIVLHAGDRLTYLVVVRDAHTDKLLLGVEERILQRRSIKVLDAEAKYAI